MGGNLDWFTCEIQTALTLRPADPDYRHVGKPSPNTPGKNNNNNKALGFEGGFYKNLERPSPFLFHYISKFTIHSRIKIFDLDELKLHTSLSLILCSTSVKGGLTDPVSRSRKKFQCQERRALPRPWVTKVQAQIAPEGLWPLLVLPLTWASFPVRDGISLSQQNTQSQGAVLRENTLMLFFLTRSLNFSTAGQICGGGRGERKRKIPPNF